AAAFGMTILGNDPKEMPDDFLREISIRMVGKDELLMLSDFVTINCDLNSSSVHLMSDKQFSMMKPTAVLINTARGPIVDEPALRRGSDGERRGSITKPDGSSSASTARTPTTCTTSIASAAPTAPTRMPRIRFLKPSRARKAGSTRS